MMAGLAAEAVAPKTVIIETTYLKDGRKATSLRLKKGGDDERVGLDSSVTLPVLTMASLRQS